jgi:hypothetical protein
MKLAALTAAALLTAGSVSAMEIGNTGVSLGATTVAEYAVNAGRTSIVLTPALAYSNWGVDLAASADIAVYDNEFVLMNALDALPTIEFSASYDVMDNASAYVKSSWDLDAMEMGEITLGVAFSF